MTRHAGRRELIDTGKRDLIGIMKKSSQVVTRQVLDITLLLPMKASRDGLWAYELNEIAAFLWKNIGPDVDENTLAQRLSEEFEVSPQEAASDTGAFIAEMRSIGAIE